MPGWKGKANHISFRQNRNNCETGQHSFVCRWDCTAELLWGVAILGKKMCGHMLPTSSNSSRQTRMPALQKAQL